MLRGTGELRKVAFHIHARIHLRRPEAACVMHVHPQYLTALSLLEKPELALSHHNNLILNDRLVVDLEGDQPVGDNQEGDRIADLMEGKSIMLMGSHGVTVAGPTVADAFDELFIAERTAMYQVTAMSTGQNSPQTARAAPPPLERRLGRKGGRAAAPGCVAAGAGSGGARLRDMSTANRQAHPYPVGWASAHQHKRSIQP